MDTRGRNTWHTTEPWHNSPLPEGVSHAVTVPPGRGGGRSGGPSGQTRTGPQDGDLQSGTDHGGHGGAGSSGGHGGAGSSGGHGCAGSSGGHGGAGSSGGHGRWSSCVPTAGTLSTPKKNFPGEVRGYQGPSGAGHTEQYMSRQPSGAKHTGTGQPTGTGSPPGLARKLRLLLGMTRCQGPSQGPSATAFTSATGGQAAGNGLRGHYKKSRLPQTSLRGQD